MRVMWDPQKAGLNLAKHGVRFSDAELVLSDPNALSRDDPPLRASDDSCQLVSTLSGVRWLWCMPTAGKTFG